MFQVVDGVSGDNLTTAKIPEQSLDQLLGNISLSIDLVTVQT
jgi:hypothetical protein